MRPRKKGWVLIQLSRSSIDGGAYDSEDVRYDIFRQYPGVVFKKLTHVRGHLLDIIIVPAHGPLVSLPSWVGHFSTVKRRALTWKRNQDALQELIWYYSTRESLAKAKILFQPVQ